MRRRWCLTFSEGPRNDSVSFFCCRPVSGMRKRSLAARGLPIGKAFAASVPLLGSEKSSDYSHLTLCYLPPLLFYFCALKVYTTSSSLTNDNLLNENGESGGLFWSQSIFMLSRAAWTELSLFESDICCCEANVYFRSSLAIFLNWAGFSITWVFTGDGDYSITFIFGSCSIKSWDETSDDCLGVSFSLLPSEDLFR